MTETQTRPTDSPTDRAPAMVHLTHPANDDVALCGTPLSGAFVEMDAPDCVVCAELEALENQWGECE